MLIDWFTVAAQILNFVILVWLLKRVLYKPIIAAIQARETIVAAELADAAAKKTVADALVAQFEAKSAAFDRDRTTRLQEAVDRTEKQCELMLVTARASADGLQQQRRDAWQREVRESGEALGRRTQRSFFVLAARAFKDLADANLEAQVTEIFCGRLRALTGTDRETLRASIPSAPGSLSVRSAFALTPALQTLVQMAFDDTLQIPVPLRFEVAPQLICGLEVTTPGRRIGWSFAEYLTDVERDAGANLGAASGEALAGGAR